jgi:hypothetical protein
LWPHTSAWPAGSAYEAFAGSTIAALRHARVQVDIGLRLVNIFAEAGLPLPRTRTELVSLPGASASGPLFVRALLRELQSAEDRLGVTRADRGTLDDLARRLENATRAGGGHIFLPLQVGAWTRL